MIRAKLIEEELRQGRLNAKTLDSMFRRRIEEGANSSPFVSRSILAAVKEVFSIGSDDAQVQLGLGQMKLLAVADEGDVALDVEPLVVETAMREAGAEGARGQAARPHAPSGPGSPRCRTLFAR